MRERQRLKILISAFSLHPQGSSEQGVGWNWSVQAARHHEVWVVTNGFSEEAVTKELEARPNPNLHVVFHRAPLEVPMRVVGRKFHPAFYPAYLSWQATALGTARRLHQELGFDIAQHLTWASHRFPSFLTWLEVPFIWGPIGGGEVAPRSLYASLGIRPALGELVREMSNLMVRLDPFVQKTASRATRILTTTEETRALLSRNAQSKTEVYPAIGLNLDELDAESLSSTGSRPSEELPRLLFIGRLISWKGCGLALAGLARLRDIGIRAHLTVVGTGPERSSLEADARKLDVSGQVEFLGSIPRTEVLRLCQSHDVLVFPSLHDSGGIAVLEAMYLGLPVVCLDAGGPAVSVGDAGIKVACCSVDQITADLAAAIATILSDDALRAEMIEKARARVTDLYDWEEKANYIRELYESASAQANADRL